MLFYKGRNGDLERLHGFSKAKEWWSRIQAQAVWPRASQFLAQLKSPGVLTKHRSQTTSSDSDHQYVSRELIFRISNKLSSHAAASPCPRPMILHYLFWYMWRQNQLCYHLPIQTTNLQSRFHLFWFCLVRMVLLKAKWLMEDLLNQHVLLQLILANQQLPKNS